VADNGNVVAGSAAEGTTVANLLLDVGNDGTFGHLTDGENVADGKSSALADVDELASVHAFVGDEGLGNLLELVRVAEDDLGERSTTACRIPMLAHCLLCVSRLENSFMSDPGELAGIVDDLTDYTTDVPMALGVVEVAELGGSLVQARVGSCTSS
jgi:hypothetical protein